MPNLIAVGLRILYKVKNLIHSIIFKLFGTDLDLIVKFRAEPFVHLGTNVQRESSSNSTTSCNLNKKLINFENRFKAFEPHCISRNI